MRTQASAGMAVISFLQGWGLLNPPFLCFLDFFPFSKHLLPIEYHNHFWRCRHSWSAATPIKYESDSKNLTVIFAKSNIFVTEILRNEALVTPTPEHIHALHRMGVLLLIDDKSRWHWRYRWWDQDDTTEGKCLEWRDRNFARCFR